MNLETIPYREKQQEYMTIESSAQTLARGIKDASTYEEAGAFLLRVRELRKRWAEIIKPAVKAAHEAHQRVKEVEKSVDSPLERAESQFLKPALARWEMDQEAIRRAEQEKINRELKAQEETRRLAYAEELEKSGKTALADAVLDTPVVSPEVILPSQTRMKGISYRTRYYAEVVDLRKLIEAVTRNDAPQEFLIPNDKVLNSIASAMKESVSPQWEKWGLAVKSDRIVSAGGR